MTTEYNSPNQNQPEFKVGDRVRVVVDYRRDRYVGCSGTVSHGSPLNAVWVRLDLVLGNTLFYSSDLELERAPKNETKKPRKHAALIKAWADGAEIQWKSVDSGEWRITENPIWLEKYEYRIKPKPDYVLKKRVGMTADKQAPMWGSGKMVNFIFDGETGELKSAEIVK